MDNRPIGVFDSGIGGFSAAKVLEEILPNEDIIYFGDSARCPYGTKSRGEIIQMSLEDAKFLEQFDVKAALIACGTITSNAMAELSQSFPFGFYGVIDAACEKAVSVSKTQKIGVIATQASIESGAYERKINALDSGISVVSKACAPFAPMVESGHFEAGDELVEHCVSEQLSSFLGSGIDTLVLGCTHYPLLAGAISNFLGDGVSLVSSGGEAAEQLARDLSRGQMLSDRQERGRRSWFTSGDTEIFEKSAEIFLGHKISAQKIKV